MRAQIAWAHLRALPSCKAPKPVHRRIRDKVLFRTDKENHTGERTLSSKLKNLALLLALSTVASTGSAQAQGGAADANDSPAMLKAAKLHNALKFKEAEAAYRDVLRTEPDNAKAHQRLGAVLAAQGTVMNDEKARLEIDETAILEEKQAIKLDPKFHLPHVVLGQIYANRGKYEDAVKEFKQAIALKPDSFKSHLDLGIAYMHLDKAEDALATYKKASEIKPDYPTPHINMGVLLQSMGRLDEAVAAEQKALDLKLTPQEANAANFNLGNIYADKKEFDNAIKAYQAALKTEPGHLLAQSCIGWMQGAKGEYDADIAVQRKIIKVTKDPVMESIARARLATALAGKGDTKGAEAEFQKCMSIKPQYPVALMDYGIYLKKNGRKDEAKSAFQKALQIQPTFKPAKDALAELDGKVQTK
jgi:tetratricopeptide (TPR) repeat protein